MRAVHAYYDNNTRMDQGERGRFSTHRTVPGRSMYEAMGLGWGNSLLGFLTLAMAPLPWIFFKYGQRLRTNPRFQVKL